MGIYRRFISDAETPEQKPEIDHSKDKPFTPADALTVSRPLLAIKAARMLLRGEGGVTPVVAVMAATDKEGWLARFIEDRWPESGLGITEHGETADTVGDAAAMAIITPALLLAPRVSVPAKIATATVLGQEGTKAVWALVRNNQYMDGVQQLERHYQEQLALRNIAEIPELPKRLQVPVTAEGKEAMAEKFTGIGFAALTNDLSPGFARHAAGAAALAFATAGSVRGEQARQDYEPQVQEMIAQVHAQAWSLAR